MPRKLPPLHRGAVPGRWCAPSPASALLIGLFLHAGLEAPALASEPEPVCSRTCSNAYVGGMLCIQEEAQGEDVKLYAVNTFPAEVTVDLQLRARGLEVVHAPRTTAVPPGGRTDLALLRHQEGMPAACAYSFSWTFGSPGVAADAYQYAPPYERTRQFRMIQGFHGHFSHRDTFAIDWSMPEGTPILAARGGVVIAFHDRATTHGIDPSFQDARKANWVLIRHDDGTLGAYWHLQPDGVRVYAGQRVERGELIALSGNTGYSSLPHLHFEIRSPVDGYRYRTHPFRLEQDRGMSAEEVVAERLQAGGAGARSERIQERFTSWTRNLQRYLRWFRLALSR